MRLEESYLATKVMDVLASYGYSVSSNLHLLWKRNSKLHEYPPEGQQQGITVLDLYPQPQLAFQPRHRSDSMKGWGNGLQVWLWFAVDVAIQLKRALQAFIKQNKTTLFVFLSLMIFIGWFFFFICCVSDFF